MAVVATLSVDDPPELTVAGENVTLEPGGPPAAESATDSLEPAVTAVEMVLVTVFPSVTEPEAGAAEIEKSSLTGTVPDVVSEVSSSTKLVVPPLASVSVPDELQVTVCPAYADRSAVRWV